MLPEKNSQGAEDGCQVGSKRPCSTGFVETIAVLWPQGKCLQFGKASQISRQRCEALGIKMLTVDLKGPRIGWARLASTSQPNISAGNIAAIVRLPWWMLCEDGIESSKV